MQPRLGRIPQYGVTLCQQKNVVQERPQEKRCIMPVRVLEMREHNRGIVIVTVTQSSKADAAQDRRQESLHGLWDERWQRLSDG